MNADEPLIHIGYHKTGTSWLQRRVFASDASAFGAVTDKRVLDEAFVTVNPLTFDSAHALALVRPALEKAVADGRSPVISHERLSGFDLLGGYDSAAIADRLHATFPRASVLIVIREQREMMLSMYKQYVKKSGTATVDKLWRKRTHQELRRPGPSLDVYEYHHLIGYYQRLFGTQRVHVLPFELLRTDARAFVGRVCAAVGVAPPDDVPAIRENVALTGAAVPVVRGTNKLLRAFGLVASDGGPVTRRRLQRLRMRTIRRVSRQMPAALSRPFDRRLRAAVDAVAGDRFGASNAETMRLTGLDLAAYGYATPAAIPSVTT